MGAHILRWEFHYTENPVGYDQLFATVAQHGEMLLPQINSVSNSYTTDLAGLSSYVGAFAARYGPGGTFWQEHPEFPASLAPTYIEIWNEPYGVWYGPVDPVGYTNMLKAAVTAGRAANPSTRYLMPVVQMNGYTDGRGTWIDGLYAAEPNLNSYFDGVAVHPYSGHYPPNDPNVGTASQLTHEIQKLTAHGAGDVPIWITEFGWTTCTASTSCVSEATQASFYSQAFALLKNYPTVAAVLAYNYRGNGQNPASGAEFFGLERPDGSHKPAWDIYRTAALAP
jgi:hypothetical protein